MRIYSNNNRAKIFIEFDLKRRRFRLFLESVSQQQEEEQQQQWQDE